MFDFLARMFGLKSPRHGYFIPPVDEAAAYRQYQRQVVESLEDNVGIGLSNHRAPDGVTPAPSGLGGLFDGEIVRQRARHRSNTEKGFGGESVPRVKAPGHFKIKGR
jgi:hypothetical protein